MPELPEVETVCRGLRTAMEGEVIVHVDQRRRDLRIPFPRRFAARLTGRRVATISRRAKYILAHLDDDSALLMHLGMSGRFAVIAYGEMGEPGRLRFPFGGPHEHVVFHMGNGARVTYTDPRRFGLMDLAGPGELDGHRLLVGLGPEPLGEDFSAASLNEALAGRRTSIKAALLDQRVVAGLGNIYVCEALFLARISPHREASSLAGASRPGRPLVRLFASVRDVLVAAIDAGGSTLRDHAATDGTLGYFQHSFMVYDREGTPCPRPGCGGTIRRAVQSGRSTFWCDRCQR